MSMKIQINDINSDRENTLRFVNSIFKNTKILNKLKSNNQLLSNYQKLSNQYNSRLRKLIYAIKSNNDYKIIEVLTQLNEVANYIQGASDVLSITTSELLINDICKVLIQFIETKFSDLLKIEII